VRLYFIAIITSISLLLIWSCSKKNDCNQAPNEFVYLSESQLSKIPYSDSNKLELISNLGDTSLFIIPANGIQLNYEARYNGGNPDCPEPYTMYEYAYLHFIQSKHNQDITYLGMALYGDRGNVYNLSHTLVIEVNTKTFNFDVWLLNDSSYKDTVTIGNTLFHGLKTFASDSSSMIYNHHYGILQVKYPDNKSWRGTLLK